MSYEELQDAAEEAAKAKDSARLNARNQGVGGQGYRRAQRSRQSKDRR